MPSDRRVAVFLNAGAALLLAVLAIAVVIRLGPFGLILLGLVTLFVSSQFALNETSPVAGTAVLRARLDRRTTPEQRAAQDAERSAFRSPARFARNCGLLLTAAGIATFLWQLAR